MSALSNVVLFISHDGSPTDTLDDPLPRRITLRISWLMLQEVVVDLVAEEAIEVGVVGVLVVEDAKMKKRSGEQIFPPRFETS